VGKRGLQSPASIPIEQTPPAFESIPLEFIQESDFNPRKHFAEAKLRELESSIRLRGIIQPIVVRSHPKLPARYEVVAGARRFRAAKAVGLEKVPAIIRVLSDVDVLEIMVIENGQRDDLHPLEEADGFGQLMEVGKYDAQTIAQKVGHDETYVYRRLALRKLIPKVRESFEGGGIQLAHAQLIARLAPPDQQLAFEMAFHEDRAWDEKKKRVSLSRRVIPARELEREIDSRIMRELSTAPWDLEDPALLEQAGPCTACPKRSSAQAALFDKGGQSSDRCLDSHCWSLKLAALFSTKIVTIQNVTGKTPVRVAESWVSSDADRSLQKDHKPQLQHHEYETVLKGKECGAMEPALVVHGENVGQQITICRSKTCKVHRGRSSGLQKSAGDRAREKAQRAKVDLERRICARIFYAIGSKANFPPRRKELDQVFERVLDLKNHDELRFLSIDVYKLEAPKTKQFGPDYGGALRARYKKAADAEAFRMLVAVAFATPPFSFATKRAEWITAAARAFKVDVRAITTHETKLSKPAAGTKPAPAKTKARGRAAKKRGAK